MSSYEHAATIGKWRNNTRQAKRDRCPHAVPTQELDRYHMRFLLTAEMIGALSAIAGLAASHIRLAIALNLATTDSIAVALAHGRKVQRNL